MEYIIYDAALNGTYTLLILQKNYPKHRSLFKGTKDEILMDVAPYIFKIDEDFWKKMDSYSEISLKSTLGIDSRQDIDVLFEHFRDFVYQKIDGRECYFRFWDPRVLKKFFPSCTPTQLQMFFGPVQSFFMEDENPGYVLQYQYRQNKLHIEKQLAKEVHVFFEDHHKKINQVS
jgi:hypothetical protein